MTKNDPIIPALESQVTCYRRLAKLAGVQHEYVQQSQTEQLLEVLDRRQEVLLQIGALEVVIAPVRKDWPAYLGRLDAASRRCAETLLAETRKLLEEITAADRNDALVLQQRKINLGRQLHQAQSGRTVNRNYAAAAYGARPSRVDVQT